MKLGFIGLGNLGAPIAENLLNKHQQLNVFNRTTEKAQPLVDKGAVLCRSVKELAAASDIVFSVVKDDAALKEITTGEEGIVHNLKKGGIHVSVSTILPATAKELASLHQQQGNHYLASPVMGRPEAVRAGKLNFLVSGEKQVVETVRPFLLQAGGAAVWEFGEDVAAATTSKLCSNFLIASAIESIAEGIQLARKSGLDPAAWLQMLTQTLFSSPIYINYGNILLKEMFEPAAFSMKLGLKDMNLVLEQAASVQATMPVGKSVQQQLTRGVEKGMAEQDWTAVTLLLK